MEIASVLPTSVEIKYDNIKVDGKYMSIVTVINYDTNIRILDTIETLMGNDEIEISFHIKRENNFEILKKLTNIISESSSEIGSVSKNQIDINVINNVKSKATELRKRIQIDNEQVYMISTYVVIKGDSIADIISKQKRYINMLYSKQIIAKPSNFRQKEAYLATLPLALNGTDISKYTHSIFTEQALAKLFPFFDNAVLNKNGILLGKANNNLCAIDIFAPNSNNYNMCVFGSSGAGKSYFVKLMIIKNAYKGIRQIIIDPEGEYIDLVENLGGYIYTSENYNPFEINEAYLNEPDFFNKKVEYIAYYVNSKFDIQEQDKYKIRELIIKTYNKYGIYDNKESLYKLSDECKVYIKPQYITSFPTIDDLICLMNQEKIKITNNFKKLSNSNNEVSNNADIYCFNLKGESIEKIQEYMKMYIPKIYELIKNETIIYFDEVWKTIGLGKDRYVIENIYNMFKTLRKKKAAIITITQDICDLFTLDDGNFGKSILNNSNIKVLFKMEWQDFQMLERMLQVSKQVQNIKTLVRGNAYVSMGNTYFNLEVKGTQHEHKLIEGENYEENFDSNG